MADATAQKQQKKPQQHEEDIVGKAYDGRLMRRLLTYLRPYKLQSAVSLVAIVIKAGADVLGPFLTMLAVNKYMTRDAVVQRASGFTYSFHGHQHVMRMPQTSSFTGWLSSNPFTGIAEIAAVYLASLVLSYGLEFVQTYLMQWTGQKVMFDLRSQIFRHLQRMSVGFFDRHPVGRLVTRVTTDVDALNEMFTSGVLAIFEDIFVLAGIVIVMLLMNWWLALLAFAVLPVILFITGIFRKHVRDSYRRIRTAIARINSTTQEHVSGMAVVQLFNREQRAFNDFSAVNMQHMEAFKDAIMAYALYYPAIELLSALAIALIIWFGGGGVLRGTVTLGVLVAFMQYAQRFFRPIQDLSDKYNILQAAMAASERVFKLLDTGTDILPPAHPQQGDGSGRIEFRNVWFTYERLTEDQLAAIRALDEDVLKAQDSGASLPSVEWILRGVSFTIDPNETAAIVGHTGAGKTTITSLMMRFYDIQRGKILVDGVDVREQDMTTLRRRFGVVLQDPFLFSGTIADNIRLGSDWITDERLERAADEVNVGDYVRSLPLQFQEPVRERGSTLSTGQKQLISFARALAHDPSILILDEATSSVDTETEMLVRSALSRMITGRTSVIIAHRLSTIQSADRILVMHKGQLRETGTHQELLAHHGLYWKLYRLQYRDQELAEPNTTQGALTPSLALGTD